MPHTSSQTFLRELDKKVERRHSCRQPIAMATGMSPLPNLAGLAPAQPLGGDGLIDLIATVPFQHADPRGGGLRTASSSSPTRAVRSGKIADSLEDPLAEFRAVKEVLAITGD